jgi:hypothetical protein
MQYRVYRTFANGNKLVTKGEVIELNPVVAKPLLDRNMIVPYYENKIEKVIPEINNKAYLVHDKGAMFFVKQEGREMGRYTKKKAIEVRDELNAVD